MDRTGYCLFLKSKQTLDLVCELGPNPILRLFLAKGGIAGTQTNGLCIRARLSRYSSGVLRGRGTG